MFLIIFICYRLWSFHSILWGLELKAGLLLCVWPCKLDCNQTGQCSFKLKGFPTLLIMSDNRENPPFPSIGGIQTHDLRVEMIIDQVCRLGATETSVRPSSLLTAPCLGWWYHSGLTTLGSWVRVLSGPFDIVKWKMCLQAMSIYWVGACLP